MQDNKYCPHKGRKLIVDLFLVIAGCTLSAFSTVGIMLPYGLSCGGLTGVCRILQKVFPINFSYLYYIGVLVILLVCLLTLGMKEAKKIVFVSILYPTIVMILEFSNIRLLEKTDVFLAAIYFGVIGGIGAGLILSRGFSFGGTDTVAKILKRKLFKTSGISQILLAIDAVIIVGSGFMFGRNIALYALISQVITTKCIDIMMFGFDTKIVQLEVLTDSHREVADYIVNDIGRGVTNVTVTGEYTKTKREKIVTLCSPRESMLIRKFIASLDKEAFVTVIHVDTVWGKGAGFSDITK